MTKEPANIARGAPIGLGVSSLESVLEYRNPAVIASFLKKFPAIESDAEEIFVETLKWMWLCDLAKVRSDSVALFIDDTTFIIDEMWHSFILHTEEYRNFCTKHLSSFLDHYPTTAAEAQSSSALFATNPEEFKKIRYRQLCALYEYVADNLGTPTVEKWFKTYRDRFSSNALERASVIKSERRPVRGCSTLTSQVLRGLTIEGFWKCSSAISYEEFTKISMELGNIIDVTEVKISGTAGAMLETDSSMPFHTDSLRANRIGWYARLGSDDEPTLLKDGRWLLSKMDKDLYPILKEIFLSIPGSDEAPMIFDRGSDLGLYFAQWLLPSSLSEVHQEALSAFTDCLEKCPTTEIGLRTGECFFVDNNRILHARGKLRANSPRHLTRQWISSY